MKGNRNDVKKILLLTTGGTIASRQGAQGLEPQIVPEALLTYVPDLCAHYEIDCKPVLNLDSSNIQAEEWQLLARAIWQCREDYDGFVVTHGTDTMAYTASMLSYMLMDCLKPVVLTGSQMPIDHLLTDARGNLYTAFAAVEAGIQGVSVAFAHKVLRGTRAVKVRTMGFEAFESVNAPVLAQVRADGLHVEKHVPAPVRQNATLYDAVCTDVCLLKLIPSTNPELFDAFLHMHYRGLVLEAFGAGGMHFVRRDLLQKLRQLSDAGISVVVCSQCLYEKSDLSLYEVGQRLLSCGVIPGRDMTSEAAVTKLMWALGQYDDAARVRKVFARALAGEITTP